MPSLSQQLKQNNQLVTTSAEEAQKLTGGMPVTSPLQAATLGSNPDSAKMIGTPNQKVNSLRTMIQGQNDQSTAERTNQPETKDTAQAQALRNKTAGAQGLTGLQQAVQQAVNQTVTQGLTTTSGQPVKLGTQAVTGETDSDKQLRISLTSNADPAAKDAAVTKWEQTNNQQLTEDKKTQILGGALGQAGAAGNAAATNTANKIQASQLDTKVKSAADTLLGHDTSSMSTDDLLKEIESQINQEEAKTKHMTTQMSDPTLSPSQRADVRGQLKDAGYQGVLSADSQLDQLADTLKSADTIQFGGQPIKVSEVLADDYISGLVAGYLQDPNSPTSKDLAKNNPDIVKLVSSYGDVIKTALHQVGPDLAVRAATHSDNLKLDSVDAGGGLQLKVSKPVMDKLIPGWDAYGSTKYNASQSGLLTLLANNTIDGPAKSSVLAAATAMATDNPEYFKDIPKMSAADLKTLFVDNKDTTAAKLNFVKNLKPLANLKTATEDDVAKAAGWDNKQAMQDALTSYKLGVQSGSIKIPQNSNMMTELSKMGIETDIQGNIQWGGTAKRLLSQKPSNLADLKNPDKLLTSQRWQKNVPGTLPNQSLIDKFKAPMADGKLDATEESAIFDSLSPGETRDVAYSGLMHNLSPEKQEKVKDTVRKMVYIENPVPPFEQAQTVTELQSLDIPGKLAGMQRHLDEALKAGHYPEVGQIKSLMGYLSRATDVKQQQLIKFDAEKAAEAAAYAEHHGRGNDFTTDGGKGIAQAAQKAAEIRNDPQQAAAQDANWGNMRAYAARFGKEWGELTPEERADYNDKTDWRG